MISSIKIFYKKYKYNLLTFIKKRKMLKNTVNVNILHLL